MTAPLVRVSQLARFWELNPMTIIGWIRQGKLAAIRSPGGHFRLRPADVRAFCEREALSVPPFVEPPAMCVVAAALGEAGGRALARALKGPGVVLELVEDPYEALIVAATAAGARSSGSEATSGASMLLVLPASAERFDATAAITALRRAPATAALPVIAFGAATRAQIAALVRAGASHALLRAQVDDLPALVRELLALAD